MRSKSALPGRVAIAAVMKQEAPYILEWVAWHRLLGFELIIADNGGTDGQSELLAKLHTLGHITRIDVRHLSVKPQIPAYNVMLRHAAANGIEFLGFLDADEFFEPLEFGELQNCGPNIVRSLFQSTGKRAIGFNWMCFGSSNLKEIGDDLVMARFNWSAHPQAECNRHFKSFCRVAETIRCMDRQPATKLHPHGAVMTASSYSHDGDTMIFNPQFGCTATVSWKWARIRHYVTKTYAEYLRGKIARGRADARMKSDWYTQAYFDAHDTNDVHTPFHPDYLARLKSEVANLVQEVAALGSSAKNSKPLSFVQTMALYWHSRPFLGRGRGEAFDKGIRTAASCFTTTYLRRL